MQGFAAKISILLFTLSITTATFAIQSSAGCMGCHQGESFTETNDQIADNEIMQNSTQEPESEITLGESV